MTKKEKEALSCMIKWFERTIGYANENDVFLTDVAGAETHAVFAYESGIIHLLKVMKKSEETGLLRWEEV